MRRLRGGEALVEALKVLGVDTVFGIPGVHTLEIYDALYEAPGIRHILCRHEQGAAMMADGYARATGRPGVTTLITGPGLLNAATGIAEAYSDSSPVLTICSQNPRPDFGGGRGYLHETKDQLGVAASVVDWARRARSAAEIPDLVYEAWQFMLAGRPQPAYLEIPIDVLAEEATFGPFTPPPAAPRRAPSPDLLAEAAALLTGARRPAIIAGGGAVAAAPDLRRLAERIGAVCLTSTAGKGVFDERGPLSLGSRGRWPAAGEVIQNCDVILMIGTEMAPTDFSPRLGFTGKAIRVDIDPGKLMANITPDLPILGDAVAAAAYLAAQVRPAPPEQVESQSGVVARALAAAAPAEAKSQPDYGRIGEAIRAAVPDDGLVVNDMTGTCYRLSRYGFPVTVPGTFLFPRGYGTLGWAVPAAIGAKLGAPQKPVVAIAGDGGFLYTGQDILTAVMYEVSLPIVLVNNESYDEIRLSMVGSRTGRAWAYDLINPDFMEFAKAFKLRGVRVADIDRDLTPAIAEALSAPGPTLIEVPVEKAGPR